MSHVEFIPVAKPTLSARVRENVLDCIDSTWISSIGKYIDQFESRLCEVTETSEAISCCNGTVALHLALLGLGIGPGDEVLVPSLTYVASVNAIRYCGATPVFVDSELDTWNLDPADAARKVTRRTKAIMAVHLYGRPAAMTEIRQLAAIHGFAVVEDAAEAIGAKYGGKPAGSLGTVSAFSFFGNKIVTCGEGGAVVTSDPELGGHIRQLKGQGQDPNRRYWFPIVGYNYRMTNIQAAIGVAQMEELGGYVAERDEIAAQYRQALNDSRDVQLPASDCETVRGVCWLFSVVLGGHDGTGRDAVMARLHEKGIETRPFFYPCHQLPPYHEEGRNDECPRAEWLAARGLSLPTWIGMGNARVHRVAEALRKELGY